MLLCSPRGFGGIRFRPISGGGGVLRLVETQSKQVSARRATPGPPIRHTFHHGRRTGRYSFAGLSDVIVSIASQMLLTLSSLPGHTLLPASQFDDPRADLCLGDIAVAILGPPSTANDCSS